jgi:phosphoribosyl 1,2-cyclic phosphodiesterase
MQFKVIGTGSSGNCYILENAHEALLIEAGVRFSEVKKALDFKIDKVVGAIITHEHGDHAKYAKEVQAAGITVHGTAGTLESAKVLNHRGVILSLGKIKQIGGFKIRPFHINHDAADPCGYLIQHADCGTVLFLTDTHYSEYTFPGVNYMVVEANYCEEIIVGRELNYSLEKRIVNSHMSLQTCKRFLAANDLSTVKSIVLIHLSDGNSDEAKFKREVEALTGKPTHVATKGHAYSFSLNPF